VLGDLPGGLEKYEWRWKTRAFAADRREFSAPRWRGEPSIAGKTVLLHAEQGLGDAIQFMRYTPLVAQLGANVVLEVPGALAGLATTLAGAPRVLVRGEPLPPFDLYCPLASLPLAFQTTLQTIAAPTPYLHTAPDRVAAWRDRLASKRPRKVGLAWMSRPIPPGRCIPLPSLAELFSLPDTDFISLHHQVNDDDLTVLAKLPNARSLGHDIADFREAAALISSLDLVVSVDTVLAHLAGALGKQVWVLVPFSPHWPWLLQRQDSPWYPTARLFRQRAHGDWMSAIAEVRAELASAIL
jgi:Glycosyltransferase family 9 (heptosyltransferase)